MIEIQKAAAAILLRFLQITLYRPHKAIPQVLDNPVLTRQNVNTKLVVVKEKVFKII